MEFSFKLYCYKGTYKVFIGSEEIGIIQQEWINKPYHIVNKNKKLSKKSYLSRKSAAEDLKKRWERRLQNR